VIRQDEGSVMVIGRWRRGNTADEIATQDLMQLALFWAAAAVEMAAGSEAFSLASTEDEASLSNFHSLRVADGEVLFLWDGETMASKTQ
jgi:hypothetical protein